MYEASKKSGKSPYDKKLERNNSKTNQLTRKGYILYDHKYKMFCEERLYGDRKKKPEISGNCGEGRMMDGKTQEIFRAVKLSCVMW